jgi:hypothetical protein
MGIAQGELHSTNRKMALSAIASTYGDKWRTKEEKRLRNAIAGEAGERGKG